MIITGARVTGARMVGTDTAAAATDEYFNLVSLLLPGNGTNGAQNNTFLDSSTNNFTVTRNGNPTQGTFSPFSQTGWSGYFDGAGDALGAPSNSAFSYGTGNFTYEAWIYPTVDGSSPVFRFIMGSGGAGQQDQFLINNAGNRTLVYYDGATSFITTNQFNLDSWNHVAVSRSSGTLKIFINGIEGVSGSSSTNITIGATNIFYIGNRSGGADSPQQAFIGYISNVRVVKGNALYTSNFTPSTTPLTAISGTSLLTCQSNRFIDNSANAFAITVNSNTSVEAFAPFDPNAAYAASTVGGSGYFDGSGDYLDIAHNTNLTFPGDFTVEFWAYPTSGSGLREWYSKGLGFQLYSSATSWGLALSANNSSSYFLNASFGTLVPGQWQHIVVTRSGNSYVGFVNGVATILGTSASAPSTGTDVLRIGDWSGGSGYPVVGYVSNVRFVQGTAVYGTTNFTPPTAPVSAISNTQLLLNYTNAGITDAAAKNVLETVGSAQISTAQSKWGGSSIYLDGTGDYLLPPPSQNFAFRTGDFTIELWIKTSSTADDGILQISTTAGGFATSYTNGLMLTSYLGTLYWALDSSSVNTSTTINDGNWHHIAMTRSGSTVRVFKNGTQISTATRAGDVTATNLVIGGYYQTAYTLDGYINDLRFTKGLARYTTTFTPPTAAFPTQ
jgi:hypothetical protein